jgi:addiction module HigA family antidote
MGESSAITMKNPSHPGGFIRTEIFDPLGLSVTEAALALGVTRPALSTFLNERASLSPEMAIRIEKAFGLKLETLMRMQNAYDIAQARRRAPSIKVKRYRGKAA